MNKKFFPWFTLVILFTLILLFARYIQKKNISYSNNRPSVAVSKTNPMVLELISGDFRGIISDYLVLQTAQFIGEAKEYIPDEDLEALAYLLGLAQHLDPYFFTIPYYAEGSLARNPFITREVNKILQTSHKKRTWDWEPGFYLGFNLFYYLHKNKEAADIFQQASTRPGAPVLLGFLAAKLRQQSGNTQASIQLLQAMLKTTKNATLKKELQKRIAAYKGVYILEQALKKYYSRHGRYPSRLTDLVKAGVLTTLPENPYHDSFWYKPKEGKVFFFSLD